MYQFHMIVFRDDKNRNENYILCNRQLENKINFYSAVDSLNLFEKNVELAINNNLQSRDYIENNCLRTWFIIRRNICRN